MDLVPTAAVIYRDVGGAVHNALFMSMGTKGLRIHADLETLCPD